MPFGIGRKMKVEPTFDRDSYAPGEAVRIVALAHGEADDRVRGGKAELWLSVELRNARGIAPGKTTPSGTWGERHVKGKAMLERIDPTADGTPRVAGSLTIPPDASPSEESENRTIEWLVRVDVNRKGVDRGRLVTITVSDEPKPPAVAPVATAGTGVGTRDSVQRIGDALIPGVNFLRQIGIGWLVLIAGWGVALPIVILRTRWPVALRIGSSLLLLALWIAVIVNPL